MNRLVLWLLTIFLSVRAGSLSARAQATLPTAPAPAFEATLKSALDRRFAGDRTGACVAAAVIDKAVYRAFVCADPTRARRLDSNITFEIGSVSKTMTALLLADLIEQKRISLDDTLAQHLPRGTKTPAFKNEPIRLKHLVTHTSGLPALPARMRVADPNNPYATLTEGALLASLGDVALKEAPGATWAYSNFAVMILSYVVSHVAKQDMESLIAARLFRPLGMAQAYIARKPPDVRTAQGHLPTGAVTSPWDIPVSLAGVGGVRASLDDMVRYARAQLGRVDAGVANESVTRIVALMAQTQHPVDLGDAKKHDGPGMGMGWVLASIGDRTVVAHEGGTGGFSAYVAIDKAGGPSGVGRAVVLLSDTALHSVGGLSDLGRHLLDPTHPLNQPRKRARPSAELVQSLTGRFRVEGGPGLALTARAGTLFVQADGQPELELAFDSQGDFYPLSFDALLTPIQAAGGGGRTFTWSQGGARLAARRVSPTDDSQGSRDRIPQDPAARDPSKTSAGGSPGKVTASVVANVSDYVGTYPLLPGFVLAVTGDSGQLYAQGTGQPRIRVDAAIKDVFVAEAVGAELTFQRDEEGKVDAMTLRQGGQIVHAKRRPAPSPAPSHRLED
jgi:D-alanyl-D-alanine-carboxypeptidase/D-alanyl-D-alanine-endopeptidase